MKYLFIFLFSTQAYAGYIKGTVSENEEGFDFWVEINSDFLGETIKSNFSEPEGGLPSVDKCIVDKTEFDAKLQRFHYRGRCLKKKNSEIKRIIQQTP